MKGKNQSQFMVIGLGRFGASLSKALYEKGKDVLAVDIDEEKVAAMENHCTHAVSCDASDEDVLRKLGVTNFDTVVICIGNNMQASIMTTLVCKELGVKQLIVKAQSEKHKTVLLKLGADHVIVPEEDMAKKLCNTLVNPNMSDMMVLSDDYSIAEVMAPESYSGKTIAQLDVRKRFGVNILAVKRGDSISITPHADYALAQGDFMIVGGTNEEINKFTEKLS